MSTEAIEIDLDTRRRTTVKPGRHSRYLVTEQDDGTLIWKPAITLTEDELVLRNSPWLTERIDRAQNDPASRTRRKLPTVRE